jgi:hypothetical protein
MQEQRESSEELVMRTSITDVALTRLPSELSFVVLRTAAAGIYRQRARSLSAIEFEAADRVSEQLGRLRDWWDCGAEPANNIGGSYDATWRARSPLAPGFTTREQLEDLIQLVELFRADRISRSEANRLFLELGALRSLRLTGAGKETAAGVR